MIVAGGRNSTKYKINYIRVPRKFRNADTEYKPGHVSRKMQQM
jgi:hypothetical protein